MIYLIIGIIIFEIILYLIIKKISKIFLINSSIFLTSGLLIIVSKTIVNYIIKKESTFFNISIITNNIFEKLHSKAILWIIIGIIMLILSIYIQKKERLINNPSI